MPVDGPLRITSTTSSGISDVIASPIDSTIRARPGPEVAVIDGVPP